MSGLGLGLGKN